MEEEAGGLSLDPENLWGLEWGRPQKAVWWESMRFSMFLSVCVCIGDVCVCGGWDMGVCVVCALSACASIPLCQLKKNAERESCKLSFIWGKMRTEAWERALRNCSKETGG